MMFVVRLGCFYVSFSLRVQACELPYLFLRMDVVPWDPLVF